MRPTFTLGIEEEYQTIDPETRDLRSHIATEMLAKGKLRAISVPACGWFALLRTHPAPAFDSPSG